MVTEFVCAVGPGQTDYTSTSSFESNCQTNVTAATTKVFGGTRTGTVGDTDSVTGSSSGATADVCHCTATQILVENIANGPFESGERLEVDGSNYFTTSDTGDSAIAVAELATTGAADGVCSLNGWITDTTNYVIFRAASGHEAQQPWDSNRWRVSVTSGTGIYSYVEGTKIENLQGEATGTGGWLAAFRSSGDNATISGCVARNSSTGSNCRGFRWHGSNSTAKNCFSYGWTQYGIAMGNSGDLCVSCTIYGCDYGFYPGNNTTKTLNVISYNNTTTDFRNTTYPAGTGYNLTDGTYAPGSNNQTEATANFQNTTSGSEDLHLASGGDPHDNGEGPNDDGDVPSTDFDGDSRSGGSSDIGADEYVSGDVFPLTCTVDTASFSDAHSAQWTAYFSQADTGDFTDTVNAYLTATATHADTADLSDAVNAYITADITHADTGDFTDYLSILKVFSLTQTVDTADFTEAVEITATVIASQEDTADLSDTANIYLTADITHADTGQFSDAANIYVTATQTHIDTALFDDYHSATVTAGDEFPLTCTVDTADFSDLASIKVDYYVSMEDAVDFADYSRGLGPWYPTHTDTVDFSDAASVTPSGEVAVGVGGGLVGVYRKKKRPGKILVGKNIMVAGWSKGNR